MGTKKKEKFSGKVTVTRAVKIFEALGFKTAKQWDRARLEKKIQNLLTLTEGTELDQKMQKRVNEILRALKQGRKIIVVDVVDAPADAKREREVKDAVKREANRKAEKKVKDKKKAKAEVKKTAKRDTAKKQAKKAVAVSGKEKKPGVIMSVLEFVKEGKPISEKQILARLKQRFPDKNPESMGRSISHVPNYLTRNRGIDVIGKNDKGQYVIKKK